MNRLTFFLAALLGVMIFSAVTFAAPLGNGKKIIYIPIDNRPVNLSQTVEVAEKLGYEIISPPEELLGTGASADKFGNPDELWTWLEKNAPDANSIVISTDAMLYGSLVGSRQHNFSAEKIMERAQKFQQLHENFPYLPIYALGTIMRTPTYTGSSAEPEYYKKYGQMIFNYTALKDKAETEKLSSGEKKKLANFEKEIPQYALDDWFGRRERNYNANKFFIDLTRAGVFNYFLLGCDDSARFSQTHLESRHLTEYSADLGKYRCQVMSGADELGMLMISRAINEDLHEVPFVSVEYNAGKGGETFPRYGNETIKESVEGAIISIGALRVPANERADFVVAVNTNYNGKTFEAGSKKNTTGPRRGTRPFIKTLNNLVEKGYAVGVADVATSNGADNALMLRLKRNNLQFKIRAYSGWNTASNSSGFLIGAGVLTKFMDANDVNELLMTRYLDDWVYQSNIRTQLANGLIWTVPGEGNANKLDGRRDGVSVLASDLILKFADENIILPRGTFLKDVNAKFIWNRLFESDVKFELIHR